jgi:hypothetical protein
VGLASLSLGGTPLAAADAVEVIGKNLTRRRPMDAVLRSPNRLLANLIQSDFDLRKAAVQEGLDRAFTARGMRLLPATTQKPPRWPVEPLREQPRNGERWYFHPPACIDRVEGEDALMAVNAF